MFDGIFHPIGRVLPISQPRLKKLYATTLLLYEEERSLGNWSYDVIRVRVTSYIIYYDILHIRFMQPEAVSYAFKLTAGTNRMTEEQCLRPKAIRAKRERGLQVG